MQILLNHMLRQFRICLVTTFPCYSSKMPAAYSFAKPNTHGCGQWSRGQTSAVVTCPVVKCPMVNHPVVNRPRTLKTLLLQVWLTYQWLALVLLSPLHRKLGLFKQFVKALDKEEESFKCIHNKFPAVSYQKVKGVFVGPQIQELLFDDQFEKWRRLLNPKLGFLLVGLYKCTI